MNQLYDLYKNTANSAQRAYIDSLVTSQEQVRNIRQDLLAQLGSITNNSPASQVLAAVALIQMKVTPVIAIHIPFGGDNHRDIALQAETTQTVIGGGDARVTHGAARVGGAVRSGDVHVAERVRAHDRAGEYGGTTAQPEPPGVVRDREGIPRGSDRRRGAARRGLRGGGDRLGDREGVDGGDVPPLQSLGAFGQTMLAAVGVGRGDDLIRGDGRGR